MNWTVIICTALACLTIFLCVAMYVGTKYGNKDKKPKGIDPSCEWNVPVNRV